MCLALLLINKLQFFQYKQFICMREFRAVYNDGDIMLLDDPLSAVDAIVGRHLFVRCIRRHLRQKAVILVTHQQQYLKSADNILVMKEGRCQAIGSFQQLIETGIDLDVFLKEESCDKETSHATLERIPSEATDHGNNSNSTLRISSKRDRSRCQHYGSTSPSTTVESAPHCHRAEDRNQTMSPTTNMLDNNSKEVAHNKTSGSVSSKVYVKYFLTGGHWVLCVVLVLAMIFTQVLYSATDYWLSYWCNQEQKLGNVSSIAANATGTSKLTNKNSFQMESEQRQEDIDTSAEVVVYSGLIATLFVLSLGRSLLFYHMCMTSSRQLHKEMFAAVIRAPIKYFDTTPIGDILNRFTKDLGQIDNLMPPALWDYLFILFSVSGIFVVISIVNPVLLLPTVIMVAAIAMVRRLYFATARDIKHLEAITCSPVFSHLSATIQGITTIRAFKAEEACIADFDALQNVQSGARFLYLCTSSWLGATLDGVSCLYLTVVIFSFFGVKDAMGGYVGLVLSSAMVLAKTIQWGVRQSAEVENHMTSVERVIELSELKPEAPVSTTADFLLDPKWPTSGAVQFIGVSLSYDQNHPTVLKELNFSIHSGEKIGIVGRTGAGKSSLISCLFRLTEVSGQILIDGVDIAKLGLHKLRKNISIIPQDPTLFTDTFRKNLDPFSQHTDEQLWHALEEVQLKDAVQASTNGLNYVLSEGGSNLSVGQRQLVCLARAILSNNPILLMDEATANIDPKTDELIQQTIREKFSSCTVLTVAHRLHTIMDSTRVMVMNKGELKEFDAPHRLLQTSNSLFSELVTQTGTGTSDHLRSLARTAYDNRQQFPITMTR